MFIERVQGSERPQPIRSKTVLGAPKYTIAFDVQDEDGQLSWSEATFDKLGAPDYAHLVAAIVKGRYSDDNMTAIVNNHLLDDGDEEHAQEWEAMQNWRKEAKALAKEFLKQFEAME